MTIEVQNITIFKAARKDGNDTPLLTLKSKKELESAKKALSLVLEGEIGKPDEDDVIEIHFNTKEKE